jgi:hypothetical protein
MAITQTGSILTFAGPGSANTGTVSTTITVPADAELVVVGWSGFSTTATFFSTGSMTFTKGGVDTAMTAVGGADSNTSFYQATMFYLVLPDTGSNMTLKWDWLGTAAASDTSSLCSVTFWKGIDTASPVRGTGGAQAASTPITTGTIPAASGDLIIAWVAGSVANVEGTVDSWTNLGLLANLTHATGADGAWATGSPSGNTTVTAATDTSIDDAGIVAASFKAAAGGTTTTMFADQARLGG